MKTLMILRGVNMETLDSDAPSECEDWGWALGVAMAKKHRWAQKILAESPPDTHG
jgi:hypothetical protein